MMLSVDSRYLPVPHKIQDRNHGAHRESGTAVMPENIHVLLGRSTGDNRRQSSFTAVIGRAQSDAKCSCICMTQSHIRIPRVVEAAHGEETRERQKRDEEGERHAEGGYIGHAGEGGWIRFPPRCVITRHYPPIKSLSNNYLTVAVTHSRSLSALPFSLIPFALPSSLAPHHEPGLPAIKASPFLNHYWMTALATTVQG